MFNGDKIKRLEDKIYGFKTYRTSPPRPDLCGGGSFTVEGQPGLIEEVKKLKAVVAELCDYVYRENK